MPIAAALIPAAGSLISGLIGSSASKSAGKTLSNAGTAVSGSINKATAGAIDAGYAGITQANDAVNTHTGQANGVLSDVYNNLNGTINPYLKAGQQGVTDLAAAMGPNGSLNQQFSFNPADQQNDPGYQFQLQQGMKAIQNSASARGMTNSGATMKSLGDFSQGLAGTSFQNSYNRALNTFQTNHQNTLAGLTALTGVGQTATNQAINVGQNYGDTTSGNLMNAGNTLANVAQQGNQYVGSIGLQGTNEAGGYIMQGAGGTAAGQMGSANAWQNAINGVAGGFGTMFAAPSGAKPFSLPYQAPAAPYQMPDAPMQTSTFGPTPTMPGFLNPNVGMG